MEHSVVYWLRAKYRANESRIVGDSATDDLLKAFRKLLHQWERNFRELADVLPRWFVSKIRGYVAGNLAQQTKPLKDAGLGFNIKFSYIHFLYPLSNFLHYCLAGSTFCQSSQRS